MSHTMMAIGAMRTPFSETSQIPKGPDAQHHAEGIIEVDAALEAGLQDVEGFSHLYVIWLFHRAEGCDLVARPPTDDRVWASHGLRRTAQSGRRRLRARAGDHRRGAADCHQEWIFITRDDDSVEVYLHGHADVDLCLDMDTGKKHLQLWHGNGGTNQRWLLVNEIS
mgnify:CR=1 FL=1